MTSRGIACKINICVSTSVSYKKEAQKAFFVIFQLVPASKKSTPVTPGIAPRERKNIDRIYLRRNASGHHPIIPNVDDIPLAETQCAGRIDNYPLPRCEIKYEQTVALHAEYKCLHGHTITSNCHITEYANLRQRGTIFR